MSERPTPVIVYLSGHLRGKTHRLWGERLVVGTSDIADVQVAPHELPPDTVERIDSGELGTLQLHEGTYRIDAAAGAEIWVNGRPVESHVLESGDVIEIGEGGPVLRYRLYEPGTPPYKSMTEVFSDCRDCARHGGGGALRRAGRVLAGAPVELATQTSPRFRVNLVIALAAVVVLVGFLSYRNARLERRLAADQERMERLAGLLEEARQDTFSAGALDEERRGLESRLSDTLARVEALESRVGSRPRIIETASRAVVFLQGAYGFVETDSGRPLRFDTSGAPATGPGGLSVTLEGDGPIVEVFYTGTAFMASPDGLLLTNRHVALPWEFDPPARAIAEQGFTPVMRRFLGYFPGEGDPFEVRLVAASDGADLAVLSPSLTPDRSRALELDEGAPRAGQEVIVLGYPAGIQALLARADAAFVKDLLSADIPDFWEVAARLAEAGHISPLATVGIVGQVTPVSIVYDAETTHGGSGGPVLDLSGRVVAVNAAIVPQFGGSNLGVPAGLAAPLLRDAVIEPPVSHPDQP